MKQLGGFLGLMVLGIVFVSGCIGDDLFKGKVESACNPPYIQVGASCCLDRNGNGICDSDEVTTTLSPPTTQPTQTTIVTTTLAKVTTTTTLAPVTTTLPVSACAKNSDCGSETTELRCSNGDVIRYIQTPQCKSPGTASAQCISKVKTSEYRTCPAATTCVSGDCVSNSMIYCLPSCEDLGYTNAYCNSVPSCIGSDVRAEPGDAECGTYGSGMYCCCQTSSPETTTTTLLGETPSTTTTTTLPGVPTHKECVGLTCKNVLGAGVNECFANFQCSGILSPSSTLLPVKTHKECVGTVCKSVSGAGINECTKNLQCTFTVSTLAIAHTLVTFPVVSTIPCFPPYC